MACLQALHAPACTPLNAARTCAVLLASMACRTCRRLACVALLAIMATSTIARSLAQQGGGKPGAQWVVALNTGAKLGGIACEGDGSRDAAGPRAALVAKEGGPLDAPAAAAAGCKVCGGAAAVAAACEAHPLCVAFVLDLKGSLASAACGHLKGSVSGGLAPNSPSQALYCNTARGAKCGAAQFAFTPRTGMMFTGDYRCGGPSSPSSSSSSSSPLCAVPGHVNAVGAACLRDASCRAFAYNRADQAGYLKDARGVASPTSGSDLYQRLAA